jgi:hypothetical protein
VDGGGEAVCQGLSSPFNRRLAALRNEKVASPAIAMRRPASGFGYGAVSDVVPQGSGPEPEAMAGSGFETLCSPGRYCMTIV